MSHRSDVPARGVRPAIGLTAVILLCLPPVRVHAQDHRFALTGYLGNAAYGNLAGELDPGVQLTSGGFYGGHAELWFGRFGARLHAGLARPTLDGAPETGLDLVAVDADLVARLRRPRPGLFFQPYAVLGLGAVRYDLGGDRGQVGGFTYESDPTTRASLVLGIGTDLGGGPVAVRVELTDIIGLASPLSQEDGTTFGPVSHVVLTLGLSFRAGTIRLPPAPQSAERPTVTRAGPAQPDTARRPANDTTSQPDSVQPRPRRPDAPPIDTAVSVITGEQEREPEDTTRMRPGPPQDTARIISRPDAVAVPDKTDARDTEARGQLFTVRVTWDPDDPEEAAAMARLVTVLDSADVIMWLSDPDPDGEVTHRRVAALRNAADARVLGTHIQEGYGLAWEWVHVDRELAVSAEAVEASTAFVDALRNAGARPGRRDGPNESP